MPVKNPRLYISSNPDLDRSTLWPLQPASRFACWLSFVQVPIAKYIKFNEGMGFYVISHCPLPLSTAHLPIAKKVRADDQNLVKFSLFKAQGPSFASQPSSILFFMQDKAVKGFSTIDLSNRGILIA